MTDNLDEYNRLLKEIKRLEADEAKAEGTSDRLTADLKQKYGCDSVEAAEKYAEKLAAKKQKAEKQFERKLEQFREQWEEFNE